MLLQFNTAFTSFRMSSRPPPVITNPLDSHRTLWMGDLNKSWNADFVADAFKTMGHEPTTVKMVTDKHTGEMSGYCFVEFADSDAARSAMLSTNGNKIPKAHPIVRFNLSFANDPRVPSVEFNLFVNNLHVDIDDAALYQIFGPKYKSCRGAKVYRNHDGTSRGLGFVRFGDQTEQQMALVELNHYVIKGQAMVLKLAAAKQRLPRSHISQGHQPYLIQQDGPWNKPTGSSMQVQAAQLKPAEPVFEEFNYPSAEEHNKEIIEDGNAWLEELEESRWSTCILDYDWQDKQFTSAIASSRW